MLVHFAQMTGRAELLSGLGYGHENWPALAEVHGHRRGAGPRISRLRLRDEAEAIRLRPAVAWVVRMADRRRDNRPGAPCTSMGLPTREVPADPFPPVVDRNARIGAGGHGGAAGDRSHSVEGVDG